MTFQEWAKENDWICACLDMRLAWKKDKVDRTWFHRQCSRCGMSTAYQLNQSAMFKIEDAVPFDEDRFENFSHEKKQAWEQYQTEEKQAYKDSYHVYLESNKWKEIRKRVLMRDNWVCQGCMLNRATQVHHLTYKHVKNELLWELISVCDECHKREHEIC